MRTARYDTLAPERVECFATSVWESPDGKHKAVLTVPVAVMVGPDAVAAVCDQLKLPLPPMEASGIQVLIGPECPQKDEACVRVDVLAAATIGHTVEADLPGGTPLHGVPVKERPAPSCDYCGHCEACGHGTL